MNPRFVHKSEPPQIGANSANHPGIPPRVMGSFLRRMAIDMALGLDGGNGRINHQKLMYYRMMLS